MEQVLNGNLEAFEPLVNPYRKRLLSLAYRISRNWEDAKEISQETLLRVFKYLKKYDSQKSFRNWLFQILVNAARNFNQKKKRGDRPENIRPDTQMFNPERMHQEREFRSRLMEYLEELSPREREVFVLRDIEDCSVIESARILECSSLAVRVHLSSARKKIRDKFKEKCPSLKESLP
ncbi:MAG: RNA polymerase sigma factor [Candidatus Aminicenantales bacterium]